MSLSYYPETRERQAEAHTFRSGADSGNFYATVTAQSIDSTSRMVDDLIGYALDTLGASRVELRVCEERALGAPAGPRR
jgi:hypothetical protein